MGKVGRSGERKGFVARQLLGFCRFFERFFLLPKTETARTIYGIGQKILLL
jgi:hypothetical protein